jgi:hypothetical protein
LVFPVVSFFLVFPIISYKHSSSPPLVLHVTKHVTYSKAMTNTIYVQINK